MIARLVKYVLPIVAFALFVLAVVHVIRTAREPQGTAATSFAPPSTSPFPHAVAGAGIVEARTENIQIGAPLAGIVREVAVEVGHQVSPGDLLFRLDDRELQAELAIRYAALAAAQAEFDRQEHLPRPEEVPVAEAEVREAAATLLDREHRLKRRKRLTADRVLTEEDLETAQYAVQSATAERDRAEAQLALLKAGAWVYERNIAAAAVRRAEAEVSETRTNLDRLRITAPVAGEILQVNVRPGEYVGTPPGEALIVLGNTERLHIRIDIDEYDIPRYHPRARAMANLKGDAARRFPLEFVRIEPFVIPKRSLTGDNTERVDTRVLQVIYRVAEPDGPRLYVGQQVDAYIEESESPH